MCIALSLSCLFAGEITEVPQDAAGGNPEMPPFLRQWAPIEPASAPPVLLALKRGIEDYGNARYASALENLPDENDTAAAGIADYILLYRAKANLMMDQDKAALGYFRLLEKQNPESPLIREALTGQCQALLKLQDPQSVQALLKNPRIKKDSEALYYQARALDLAGEKEKAAELYIQLYAGYPKSDFSGLAERNLHAISPMALKGRRSYPARLQRAENLLRANDARGARTLLLALGKTAAPDRLSGQKRSILLAEAEYKLGRTSVALSHVRKVASTDASIQAKAIRLEGFCYRRLDREKAFLAQRDRALKLYPQSSDAEELCYSAATYFDVNSKAASAQQAYQLLLERFPKGRYAERSLWKIALFHYSGKNYAEAASGFWRYLQAHGSPESAGAPMYWMGRCYEMLGASANAIYLYGRAKALSNESYYGQKAREAEDAARKSGQPEKGSIPGIDFESVMSVCDAIRLPAFSLPEPRKASIPLIERARQLWTADLPELAVAELRQGTSQHPQDAKALGYMISRIYESQEAYYKSITSLRALFPEYASYPAGAMPNEIWRLLFPIRHWDAISDRASKHQLNPSLILGLIRQESAFNQNARSAADARGLMQILPSTAPKLARQEGISRYSAKKLYQADINIALGTRYLSSLVLQYGKIELALAAYNAGSTRVNRWLQEFGTDDMTEFVERIPFSETRGYIRQVLSNRAVYQLLISSAVPADR